MMSREKEVKDDDKEEQELIYPNDKLRFIVETTGNRQPIPNMFDAATNG